MTYADPPLNGAGELSSGTPKRAMSEALKIRGPSLAGAGAKMQRGQWGPTTPPASPPISGGPTRKLSGHRAFSHGLPAGGAGVLHTDHCAGLGGVRNSCWGRPTGGSCGASQRRSITTSPTPPGQERGSASASIRSAALVPGGMGAEAPYPWGWAVAGQAHDGAEAMRFSSGGSLLYFFGRHDTTRRFFSPFSYEGSLLYSVIGH